MAPIRETEKGSKLFSHKSIWSDSLGVYRQVSVYEANAMGLVTKTRVVIFF